MVYALGGGHGHVVRGASLAAALAKRVAVCLLVPAARLELARALAPAVEIRGLARCRPEALAGLVDEACQGASTLLVDVFAEGLLDELQWSTARVRRVALVRVRRDLGSERYARGRAARPLIVDVEPNLGWCDRADARIGPVARQRFSGDAVDVLLLPGEDEQLAALFRRLAARLTACGVAVAGARASAEPIPTRPRVVVGAAGYNLTYELARAGIHHLAIPRPRPFDDQRRRAAAVAEMVVSPAALEQRVLEILVANEPRASVEVMSHAALAEALIDLAAQADV